jgi:mRNA interferase HigB
MHVITRKRLNEFASVHPDARTALGHWYGIMKTRNLTSLNDLKTVFPAADKIGKLTVFNIAGNKYRLVAAIHYNRKRIYIRAVLTHEEYDKASWKE